MIIGDIRDLILLECNKTQNVFGSAFFDQHILIVKEYACRLAELLGADRETVEISAYLHDISAVRDISTISRHSDLSAEIAGSILMEKSYNPCNIEIIKKVIKSHSTPIKIGEGILEEVCISNADAISQIVKPTYWLYFAFSIRKLSYTEGISWYKSRIEGNYEGLIDIAKDIINEKYSSVKNLFEF
jgi:uncharacterized protein